MCFGDSSETFNEQSAIQYMREYGLSLYKHTAEDGTTLIEGKDTDGSSKFLEGTGFTGWLYNEDRDNYVLTFLARGRGWKPDLEGTPVTDPSTQPAASVSRQRSRRRSASVQ